MSEICYSCKSEIRGRVTWLAEDLRDEGGEIQGPFPMHLTCANQPWPLFEITETQAQQWATHGSDCLPRRAGTVHELSTDAASPSVADTAPED